MSDGPLLRSHPPPIPKYMKNMDAPGCDRPLEAILEPLRGIQRTHTYRDPAHVFLAWYARLGRQGSGCHRAVVGSSMGDGEPTAADGSSLRISPGLIWLVLTRNWPRGSSELRGDLGSCTVGLK